ncbi:MAG: dockerin type I domain-containing protein, partial [Acidobacteriota bacterium]
GSSARWNGSGLTTRFVSATQLQADLSTSEVSAPGASTITVNDPFGNAGVSSVPFTVDADETPPVVTAPGSTTAIQSMCSGGNGGTDAASDPAIAAFLAGGTGADECSASTTHLVAQVGGADVTATTFFPAGTTSVAFRFSDASGNVGSATSNLTVRLFGDLNLDGVADASDLVIFSNYVVHNLNAGTPPFLAPAAMADLNGDGFGDSLDLVILSNYAVHNIPCLPQP